MCQPSMGTECCMKIDILKCPSCGHALPENTHPNQLVKCPSCNMTLLISEWQIGDSRDAVLISTSNRTYSIKDLLIKDDVCNYYRCSYALDGKDRQGYFRIAR